MIGFRVARRATRSRHVVATAIQIVVFWSFFLWVLPECVHRFGLWLGEPGLALHRELGLGLFLAASCLGLASAWAMSTQGEGTPLPIATARLLVVRGPYRVLRNPMALAGITQGVAVGIWRDSPMVVAYAVAGAVAWQLVARPPEERDLVRRFGDPYVRYRDTTALWFPRLPGVFAWLAALAWSGLAVGLLWCAGDDEEVLARSPLAIAALWMAAAARPRR
ncbi:MAG: hypothetical protein MUC36_17770 [Planctomycetes bacterium]|jgi:protein-S-isoprenylcysteine O-methyltransferase Ste14|nr:hypothetical protein [Planctomycetota bacterium]